MNELANFVSENPQVSASFITAGFGILGIFINIIINIIFRKHDYKNKNKMKQIENMDLYYLPLLDKIENTIESLKIINEKGGRDLYLILDGDMGAEQDYIVNTFKLSLSELNSFFCSDTYKFQDDFKLFKKHRIVKSKVNVLEQYINLKIRKIDDSSLELFLEELITLSVKIRYCGAKILTRNCFCRIAEYFTIFKSKKR